MCATDFNRDSNGPALRYSTAIYTDEGGMNNDAPAHTFLVYADPVCCLAIMVIALAIGMVGVDHSGEQWLDDGGRYCNNGAMVHDWLESDDWSDPVGFAKENYVQYPAHCVP